ncbi:hypothetical protein [Streptomyces griseoaurantiacus]|uniref:hypothetical protein n=1 Tax=Streptomyces griseoaurantiacus TaxID=68213 RepID=UPI0036859A12
MSDQFVVTATTFRPPDSEPTCCPDAFLCLSGTPEIECPRHGGFDVCCARPDLHIGQDRDVWHQKMGRWEQSLLDEHIRQHLTTA